MEWKIIHVPVFGSSVLLHCYSNRGWTILPCVIEKETALLYLHFELPFKNFHKQILKQYFEDVLYFVFVRVCDIR